MKTLPTKQFHLSDILSVTTGKLVSTRHMHGIYEILNFMLDDNLFTHQLPRATEQCKPVLFEQHPSLATIEVPDDLTDDTVRWTWLTQQIDRFGDSLLVAQVAFNNRVYRDPLVELSEMVGPEKIIVVEHD